MKKTWGIALAVAGMLAAGSAGVYAGSNLQEIKAFLNNSVTIQVNGSPYTPVDSNGKKLTPITYNGLTYLPVRAIGEAVGVPVSYDAETHKVLIGKGAGEKSGSSVSSGTRPKYLPQDIPVSSDAMITDAQDNTQDGKKQALLVYLTKDSIETVGKTYTDYINDKKTTQTSKVIDSRSMVITGKLGGKSPISIVGGYAISKSGYTEVTIKWSES